MEATIKIIGMVGYLLLCICAAGFAVALAFHCCEKAFEKILQAARDSERKRITQGVLRDSWWFSEDERTMLLFQNYAANRLGGQSMIEDIRRDWQNYAKK